MVSGKIIEGNEKPAVAQNVQIEDFEGWLLFGGRSSVVEHQRLKPGTLGSITDDYRQPLHILNIQHHLCSTY